MSVATSGRVYGNVLVLVFIAEVNDRKYGHVSLLFSTAEWHSTKLFHGYGLVFTAEKNSMYGNTLWFISTAETSYWNTKPLFFLTADIPNWVSRNVSFLVSVDERI